MNVRIYVSLFCDDGEERKCMWKSIATENCCIVDPETARSKGLHYAGPKYSQVIKTAFGVSCCVRFYPIFILDTKHSGWISATHEEAAVASSY